MILHRSMKGYSVDFLPALSIDLSMVLLVIGFYIYMDSILVFYVGNGMIYHTYVINMIDVPGKKPIKSIDPRFVTVNKSRLSVDICYITESMDVQSHFEGVRFVFLVVSGVFAAIHFSGKRTVIKRSQ